MSAPAGRQPQWRFQKYLLDDEPPVVVTRRHWTVLLEPAAKFVPPFLVGGWLFLLDPRNRVTSVAGLVVLVAAVGYLALRARLGVLRATVWSGCASTCTLTRPSPTAPTPPPEC